jgi:bis(5'-adenosyl)-triphosphatase
MSPARSVVEPSSRSTSNWRAPHILTRRPVAIEPQVFHVTSLSYAFVNLKPLLPGHVLVSPLRRVPRLSDLTPPEVADLFLAVQRVGRMVERVFEGTSLNIAIQDGADAGQSVAHLHTHIIPRKSKDLPNTDDIYGQMDGEEGNVGKYLSDAERGHFPAVDADESRQPRSLQDMVREAQWLADEMKKEPST